MPLYVCSQLTTADQSGTQNCEVWQEAPSSPWQELAITQDQAQEISTAIALLLFTAWAIQKVAHVIQSRSY